MRRVAFFLPQSVILAAMLLAATGTAFVTCHEAEAQAPAKKEATQPVPAKQEAPPKTLPDEDVQAQPRPNQRQQAQGQGQGQTQTRQRRLPTQDLPPHRKAPFRDDDHNVRVWPRSWRELRTDNVVMQQRDYSCGAAALATMIRYHWGDNVTETGLLLVTLRMLTAEEMQDRIRNGLSLTDLRRLAVKVGYQASIGKLDYQKLQESKIPLIVGIIVEGYDHFVVVRGADGIYVYLADPARGNIRVLKDDFLKQWQKNLALVVVKPGVDPNRVSPLAVRPEEMSLGELNRLFVRRQLSTNHRMTIQPPPGQ